MNPRAAVGIPFLVVGLGLVGGGSLLAAPSSIERPSEEVCIVRDDAGNWGGPTTGMTHQRGADYQAKKILDLAAVPEDLWAAANQVRLSAFFCVRDYSTHEAGPPNGLDEAIQIEVNGHVLRLPTSAGLPVYDEKRPMLESFQWHATVIPKEWLVRGPNEIVLRLAPPEGKRPDDYIYLGIDNTVAGGNSWVKLGKADSWRQDQLNAVGAKGEYMVRLCLIRKPLAIQATWRPQEERIDDPQGVVRYAGSHGPATQVEWDPADLDPLGPITLSIETAEAKPFGFQWLDPQGEPVQAPLKAEGPRHEVRLEPPGKAVPSGVRFDKALALKGVTLAAWRNPLPSARRVDMAPLIQAPKGTRQDREPSCQVAAEQIALANDTLRCRFVLAGGKLKLASLWNELAAAEMIRRPDDCALLMIEVDGKRYAGSRDFFCRSVESLADRHGFAAKLVCEPIALEAVLSAWVDDALRLGLAVTNRGPKPLDFKLAFPHLSGLAVSAQPADDYYFFPRGGGIISDEPAVIRNGYGDHEALYQVMDLFSPERGAGLAVWCTDADGRHKVLGLRKHVAGRQEINADTARPPTAEEFLWTNSLEAVPGVGMAFEYLRRTRQAGESFAAKDAALQAHAGDWHAAMKAYADWCHRVWKFRPYPSRLGRVVNMIAAGWGQSPLFRDGHYRTDFVGPRCDCIELMSWWEWSLLGPWRTPFDQLSQRIGEPAYRGWLSYFVKDPVTGQTMFTNGPGDYDGYNQRWGGLPAFREAIKTYRNMGALATLYTDPLRVDDNTQCGQRWGKLYCIVKPDGTPQTHYDAWNPCLEVAEYRQWVAETMARVMRETDADGIRLDEYGHRGSACFSTLHAHTFAEHGTTEWQRCVAESTKLVRQAMDAVKPGSVLTTEHPGYDFLMPFIDGCITYDLTVLASPLRPLECNTQRFYFPECKCYELDHRHADPKHRKRFWNAVASFGAYYPANMDTILRENDDALASRDCQPLIPTLARLVYANQFRAGQKTIYTLYNATGHSFFGPALRLDLKQGEHVFDLLGGREADCTAESNATTVRVFLQRDDVGCLARLPQRLSAQRSGSLVEIAVRDAQPGWQVALCDAEGQAMLTRPIERSSARLSLADVAKDAKPAVCLKLLDGKRLVDILALPAESGAK